MTRAVLAFAIPLPLALAAGCMIPDRTFEADDGGVDQQELLVEPLTLDLPEGATGTFDVTLRHDPRATVTAAITLQSGSPLSVDPPTLTFTSADYAAPHTVTVTAPIDANTVTETTTITVSGAGAAGVETVTVRAVDGTQLDTWGWPPDPTPFPSTILVPAGAVFAYKIGVGRAGDVDAFHTHVPTAVGSFRMALYTDDANKPGTLVAEMPAGKVLVNGSNDGPIANGPQIAQPSYFLAIRFSAGVNISYAAPGVTELQCVRNFNIPAISDPWPSSFGAAACTADRLVNIWLTTRHQ